MLEYEYEIINDLYFISEEQINEFLDGFPELLEEFNYHKPDMVWRDDMRRHWVYRTEEPINSSILDKIETYKRLFFDNPNMIVINQHWCF